MGEVDVIVQRVFKEYVVFGSLFVLLLWVIWKFYPVAKINLLKKQLLESEIAYEIAMRYHRQELLSRLYDISSADWTLRNRGVIRIVDVGVKTGINLRYFPNSSHVIAVDTKLNLECLFAPFAKTYDTVKLEKCVEFDGECLKDIPSNYADVVVAAFVLCKSKTGALLNEIHRVLAPGGRYCFIEHTIDARDPQLSKRQSLLTNSGLWPYLFDGCRLNVDMERLIKCGPFSSVECEFVVHRFKRPLALKYVRTHILGYAIK